MSRSSSTRLGQRDAAVDVELGGLVGDVVGRDVGVEGEIEAHGAHERAAVAAELGDRLGQQVAVELEADRGDVPRLLVAEQAARAAQLEIAQRHAVARAELRVVGERGQARARLLGELAAVGVHEVGVGGVLATADAPADLVQLRQAEHVGALDDRAC